MPTIQTYEELRTKLASYADDEYRIFSMRTIPTDRPFIGVRIPQIRQLANRIPKDHYDEFLQAEPVAVEEVLLRGMLICKLPYDEMLKRFDSQVSLIDNWCTCDIFCSGLRKVVNKHQAEFLEQKIEPLLASDHEFETRIGLVLLKSIYVNSDHLPLIFDRVERLASREEYYVRMAIAWLISECFIKYPEEGMAYLIVSKLPKWTFNKAISKICDSYRIDATTRQTLRKMRK